jgi:hypothetical protein
MQDHLPIIKVRKFPMAGRHGDRATVDTPYTRYEVHLVSTSNPLNSVIVREWSGYDDFGCRVEDQRAVKKEVDEYTNRLWDFFGTEVQWVNMRKVPPVPADPEWEEVVDG